MSEEIVRRLRNRSQRDMDYLKESMSRFKVNEAEDEEDEEEFIPGGPTEEEDTSVDEEPMDDTPLVDTPEDEEFEEEPAPPAEEDEPLDDNNPNPLDNIYAVQHRIGDEVTITFTNGNNSFLKGVIEGYDKEGFYRVKWEDGMITNGLTDTALSELLQSSNESKCVCGGHDFITEGKYVVCDACGRRIRESEDPLSKADKSRPAGKKIIRSEAHPVSTKMSMSETIKNAFKRAADIREDIEDDEDEEEEDIFVPLNRLKGEFWTRRSELVDDIEDLGFMVEEINSEYVLVSAEDADTSYALQIPIAGTSRTMTLDFNKARRV